MHICSRYLAWGRHPSPPKNPELHKSQIHDSDLEALNVNFLYSTVVTNIYSPKPNFWLSPSISCVKHYVLN